MEADSSQRVCPRCCRDKIALILLVYVSIFLSLVYVSIFLSRVDSDHQFGFCALAHYKYKSLEEYRDRRAAFNTSNGYMRGKLLMEDNYSYMRHANEVENRRMLVWARALHWHTNQPLQRTHARGFLASVTLFRHEDAYLEEWLHWNLMQGVDFFYLYANGGYMNSTRTILQPFVDLGMMQVIEWDDDKLLTIPVEKRRTRWNEYNKISVQGAAMIDATKRFAKLTKWFMKIDVDEYVYATSESQTPIPGVTLRTMLKASNGWNLICPRVTFGPNYHETKPSGLVLESYTRSAAHVDGSKGIVRTDMIDMDSDDLDSAHFFPVLSGSPVRRSTTLKPDSLPSQGAKPDSLPSQGAPMVALVAVVALAGVCLTCWGCCKLCKYCEQGDLYEYSAVPDAED